MSYEIEEKRLEAVLVAGLRMTGKYSDCGEGLAKVCRAFGRHMAGKPMCLYYDAEYKEDDADFEPCVPLRQAVEREGFDVRELPACDCVSLVHRGPYEQLHESYQRIRGYADEKGYEIALPTREVYLKGPGMFLRGNPAKYLTEIQLPIRR